MTAPDPGLTDLIAAHLRALIAEVPLSSYADDDYDVGRNQGFTDALNFLLGSKEFASVVEQYTNGRIAELEAAIARVEKLAHDMRGWCSPHGISVTYSDRIFAAVRGEPK